MSKHPKQSRQRVSKPPKRFTLRAARKRAGFTQQELALLSRVGQGMISKLESGHVSHPRFSTVIALARALRMDPEALRFDAAPILHGIAEVASPTKRPASTRRSVQVPA